MIEVELYDSLGYFVSVESIPKHVDTIIKGENVFKKKKVLEKISTGMQEIVIYILGTSFVVTKTPESGSGIYAVSKDETQVMKKKDIPKKK